VLCCVAFCCVCVIWCFSSASGVAGSPCLFVVMKVMMVWYCFESDSLVYVSDRTYCRGAFPSTRCSCFFFFFGAEIAFFAIFYGYYVLYDVCSVFFLASNGRAWRQRVVR
jgi:hypothetical protein